MFVVMAVQTKQLPVAAIGRVVVVVVVFVMHGQFHQVGVLEFPSTAATYPGVEFKGFIPVISFLLMSAMTGLITVGLSPVGT